MPFVSRLQRFIYFHAQTQGLLPGLCYPALSGLELICVTFVLGAELACALQEAFDALHIVYLFYREACDEKS